MSCVSMNMIVYDESVTKTHPPFKSSHNPYPCQLVNIDNFFPVFLLIIIGNSLVIITLVQIHTSFEKLLNWCHLGIIIKVVSKLPLVITVVTIPSFVKIGPPVLEKKIFEGILPYMGVAAILNM